MKAQVAQHYGDQFTVYYCSFGAMRGMNDLRKEDGLSVTLPLSFSGVLERELPDRPQVKIWDDFVNVFSKDRGVMGSTIMMLIDEVNTVHSDLLDLIVGQFRNLHLSRGTHWLHGLTLIGIGAVLGLDSQRGSPFNVQRALLVPNLTQAEVIDLYQQYQAESGQTIEPEVVLRSMRQHGVN